MARPDAPSVSLVRDAFWLLGDVDVLSQRFDARLACLTPRAEAAFAHLFPRSGESFVSVLLRAVDALGAEPEPEPGADADTQVQALARRLVDAGMHRRDLPLIATSLARAVRDSYTGEWTPALDGAWSAVGDWLGAGLQAAVGDGQPDEDEPAGPVDPLSTRLARLGLTRVGG